MWLFLMRRQEVNRCDKTGMAPVVTFIYVKLLCNLNRGFQLKNGFLTGVLFIPIKVIHTMHRLIHRFFHEMSAFYPVVNRGDLILT